MKSRSVLFTLTLMLVSSASGAQTTVTDAWIRGTVAQQKASGLFARLASAQGARLVSVSTPVAGLVEIHEMSMAGDMMKMRALPNGLVLPAGKAVELKPGGYHVMLMDLKQQLKAGDTVTVTWVLEGADKKRETVEVKVPVKAQASAGAETHKH